VGLGVYEGRCGLRAYFDDWIAPFEDFVEAELEEVRDLGNEVIF
jgi:hypothetical protein